MKLFEEFKEYETLWEEKAPTKKFLVQYGILNNNDRLDYKEMWIEAFSDKEAVQKVWDLGKKKKLKMRNVTVLKVDESLQETVRVVSNPDVLYHWTNPTPFLKIFTENCLRADVNMNCVCFTTDKDYMIYEYPCGIKFSREKLLKAGYELEEADEFDWDPDGIGESEERIFENIDNVSAYVTAVGINWEHISIVQSKQGARIADANYDEFGDELENYELMLDDFMTLLNSLKAKGIKVVEQGKPNFGEYYLDDNGKLKYGKMPA